MTPGEKKQTLLVTRYGDGAARSMEFISSQQLLLGYSATEEGPLRRLLLDLEESAVLDGGRLLEASAPTAYAGALADCDLVNGLAALSQLPGEIAIRKTGNLRGAKRAQPTESNRELSAKLSQIGKLVRRFSKAGKRPQLRFADDGASLFSSASEVLNRWDLTLGRAQKFKCHDRVTHVAATSSLVVAQNKEGVLSLFDARRRVRLVSVRPTLKGWLAFADDGAWDCSAGFTRGAELSWTDAKSTAFIPGKGFGRLELNQFPLEVTAPSNSEPTRGLIALRTSGRW